MTILINNNYYQHTKKTESDDSDIEILDNNEWNWRRIHNARTHNSKQKRKNQTKKYS